MARLKIQALVQWGIIMLVFLSILAVIVFWFEPRQEILVPLIGLGFPILFLAIQMGMNYMISGSVRSEGEVKYRIWKRTNYGRLNPGDLHSLDSLKTLLTTVNNEDAETSNDISYIEELEPKIHEISFGVELIVTALSALVVSASVQYLEVKNLRFSMFMAIFFTFIATIVIIITLQRSKIEPDADRSIYVLFTNIVGLGILIISFFSLGNTIIS